jgi:hypothetical protein
MSERTIKNDFFPGGFLRSSSGFCSSTVNPIYRMNLVGALRFRRETARSEISGWWTFLLSLEWLNSECALARQELIAGLRSLLCLPGISNSQRSENRIEVENGTVPWSGCQAFSGTGSESDFLVQGWGVQLSRSAPSRYHDIAANNATAGCLAG